MLSQHLVSINHPSLRSVLGSTPARVPFFFSRSDVYRSSLMIPGLWLLDFGPLRLLQANSLRYCFVAVLLFSLGNDHFRPYFFWDGTVRATTFI